MRVGMLKRSVMAVTTTVVLCLWVGPWTSAAAQERSLVEATRAGDLETVRRLLASGANPPSQSSNI